MTQKSALAVLYTSRRHEYLDAPLFVSPFSKHHEFESVSTKAYTVALAEIVLLINASSGGSCKTFTQFPASQLFHTNSCASGFIE